MSSECNRLRVYLGDQLRPTNAHAGLMVHQEHDRKAMNITFHRTIRVPDNDKTYNLPPGLGTFPVYSVAQYKSTIPESILLKGGCFMPIHEREALWIRFESVRPFAVRVLLGGINAISGEPAYETFATALRRSRLVNEKKSIQDYVIVDPANKGQLWLDGIAKLNGKVQQFVAVSSGSGYSVEAQITGAEAAGGIQICITPIMLTEKGFVRIGRLDGSFIECSDIRSSDTVYQLMKKLSRKTSTPIEQFKLLYENRVLEQNHLLSHYGIDVRQKSNQYEEISSREHCDDLPQHCTLYEILNIRGGGIIDSIGISAEMSIAAGGLIKQAILRDTHDPEVWDAANTIMFNCQLLNARLFQRVTGMAPPRSPVTAETYAAAGLPFFVLSKEIDTGVEGNFEDVKSIAQLDAERGLDEDLQGELRFPVILLDRTGHVPAFRAVRDLERQLRAMGLVQSLP